MCDMNYPQIVSPCPLCLQKWGSCPPAPMGAPPMSMHKLKRPPLQILLSLLVIYAHGAIVLQRNNSQSFTANDSVVDSSIVFCRVDIGPVRSYKRSGRIWYRKRAWCVFTFDCLTERDETVRVYLKISYIIQTNILQIYWYRYTPCLKKLCRIVFTSTLSNFHQFW